MSRRFWVRIRLLGWTLMLAWFIIYNVHLLLHQFNHEWIDVLGGIIGALGTFLVLVGYYKLMQKEF